MTKVKGEMGEMGWECLTFDFGNILYVFLFVLWTGRYENRWTKSGWKLARQLWLATRLRTGSVAHFIECLAVDSKSSLADKPACFLPNTTTHEIGSSSIAAVTSLNSHPPRIT